MNIESLTSFFMWCTIINGSLFILWVTLSALAPNLIYRMQTAIFPLPRETYNVVIYSAIAFFKLVLIFFNIVPYIALLIIG